MCELARSCATMGPLVKFEGMDVNPAHTPTDKGELLPISGGYFNLEEDISLILMSLLVPPSSKCPLSPLVPVSL